MTAVWTVPGQDRAMAALRGAVDRGEVAHAYAFIGPPGVGQEQAARTLLAAMACPQPSPPCGVCDVCTRALRGAHPALSEFAPIGAFHRVDDVREQWLRTAFRSAPEGPWKVLRILDADRMHDAAANAFLKGLEEPPPGTTWVLEIADPDELPDTILSRCRVVPFSAWGPVQLGELALELGMSLAEDRALAVRASLGSPTALRRFAAPGGLDDLRRHRGIPARLHAEGPGAALLLAKELDEECKRRTAALKATGKAELAALAELYGDAVPRPVAKQIEERLTREEREARTATLQASLDDLVGWYRDCLLIGGGGSAEAVLHADAVALLRQDAARIPPSRILRDVDRILAARESLETNVQTGLALEALFLELAAP